jgi:hypothetical protein
MSLVPEKESTKTPFPVCRTLIKYIFPTFVIVMGKRQPFNIIRDFD